MSTRNSIFSNFFYLYKKRNRLEENFRNYSIYTEILVYNRNRTSKRMNNGIFCRKSEENDDVREAGFDKITW